MWQKSKQAQLIYCRKVVVDRVMCAQTLSVAVTGAAPSGTMGSGEGNAHHQPTVAGRHVRASHWGTTEPVGGGPTSPGTLPDTVYRIVRRLAVCFYTTLPLSRPSTRAPFSRCGRGRRPAGVPRRLQR